MANSKRLYKDRDGNVFIPMNVEGGVWEENFLTSGKIAALVGMLVGDFVFAMWVGRLHAGWVLNSLLYIFMIFIDQLIIRFVVFEEKYYYRMYTKMKVNSISTPAVFWDIASMKDTEDGAILVYSDMKMGVIVRVERDTITGKPEDFKEAHFDAISDFYKEINLKRYKFIQMNIMEQAGKDPRLQTLDELTVKSDNKNIASLIEMQVGHIKNITRATLFESDYFLIYTDEISKSDVIVSDVIDCVYKLLDGAFIGFSILSSKEVLELFKEIYGVKYFDYTEATLNMFKNNGLSIGKSFNISEIHFNTGEEEKVGSVEINRLNLLASYIIKNDVKYGEWTIKDALKGKIKSSINNNAAHKENTDIKAGTVDAEVTKDYIDLDNYAFGVDTNGDNHGVPNEKVKKEKKEGKPQFERKSKKDNTVEVEIQQEDKSSTDEKNINTNEDELIDF